MSKKRRRYILGAPHLFRQRGRARNWSGLIDGREVSLGTSDAAEAQQRLDALTEQGSRSQGESSGPPPIALADLGDKYFDHIKPPRMTVKTADDYENRALAFITWAEERGVTMASEVDFRLMSAFVKERGAKVKARTVNRDVRPVRRMFAFARRECLIASDPFRHEDFRELHLREALPKPNALTLSPTQVDKTVKKAAEMLSPGHASLVALLAGSGIRVDEARHLDVADVEVVDEKRGFITITPKDGWQPKSYRFRTVPVSRTTCDAALKFIETRGAVRLDNKATWDAINKVREKLELPRFSMHDLRRAWASAMHANGASIKQVSVWLGHSTIAVTERYIRVFEAESTGHEFLPR
jgi:site-specific recombinase XerD